MRISKSTHRVARFAAVVLSVFLAVAASGGSATAQTDLDGSDLLITGSGPWNVSYTNRNNSSQSIVAIRDLNNGTRYTYSGAFTGNIHIDITHGTATNNNENRFTFSNTGNSFTGGITMHGGILYVSAANQLPSGCALTLDNSILMSSVAATYSGAMTIPAGSFGGIRPSADITYSGVISGDGDLFITAENGKKVKLSGANTYTGVTSIGTHQGGSTSKDNSKAYLILGTNNTLPATTVVEMGKSQNTSSDYSYTGATVANLELNGKTQTIGGLYGSSVATVTANAASTLTINTPSGKNYAYDGSISGTVNLVKTGAGTQTLSGDGKSVSLASLAINEGTLAFGDNVNLTVSGKLTSASTLNLNGSNLTYTSNSAGDFNNVAITNTNTATQSVVSIVPSSALTAAQTLSQKISGNTRLVVKLPQNQENNSRLVLNNSSNDFTGGLYIEQGTVRVDNLASLGSNKVIDMKHSSLMTNQTFEGYTINLVGNASAGERGAIRLSGGNGQFAAKVTGVGSLEIVYDGAVTLTNTNNDYQGKTYIGNFQWRASSGSGDTSAPATLNLGASGVLPDTTDVVFGKNAEGNGTSGAITLNLQGYDETVSYISGQSTNASITSSTPATLTLIGNNNYTFVGKVTGSATVDKKGTGTLTMTGANTGSLVVSEGTLITSGSNTGALTVNGGTLIASGNNSGAQSITIGENGTFIPTGTNSAATQIYLEGGMLNVSSQSLLDNSTIIVSQGNSTINLAGPESGTYSRQLFTGASKDMSYFTNPEFISNMDLIANTAYSSGAYDANIWGSKTGDQNNTNLLQTSVVNTTDLPITLDFAYQFHNSAYLAITDSEGNKTVVMDWTNTATHKIDGKDYNYASNTGLFTFQSGETYTIEARIFRFNRTIGANGGGVNGFGGTLVGLGAKVSGTDGEYLPLNFDGDNWTFSDGSFTFSNLVSFSAPVTINAEASLTFNAPNKDLAVFSTISGAGTLNVNPAEGFTHTYSGSIADTISIAKSGEGTMAITGNCNSVGSVSVEAGTLEIAFDDPTTTLNIASIAMSEGTNINVASGAVTFDQENVTLNNLSGGSLKDDGTIDVASNVTVTNALTLNNIDTTKFIGSISANNIKKTGDGTLQLYSEASLGGIQAESFVVSSGRLDMKEYFKGSTEIESGATLSPGNSIGKLTIDGTVLDSEVDALILHTGSTLLMEVGGETPEENDMLIVLGDFTLEDGAVIQLVLAEDNTLGTNGNFAVQITADGIDLDTIEIALSYYQFSGVTVTQNGSTFTITGAVDPNAVPEPSTWVLLLLGVAGLIYWRKKNS